MATDGMRESGTETADHEEETMIEGRGGIETSSMTDVVEEDPVMIVQDEKIAMNSHCKQEQARHEAHLRKSENLLQISPMLCQSLNEDDA